MARRLLPRIVIVSTDQWLRAGLRAELRERGYDAVGARDLAEAVRVSRPEPGRGPVCLVVVDQLSLGGGIEADAVDRLHRATWRARLVLIAPALAIHEPLQFVMLAAKGHLGAYVQAVRGLIAWLPTLASERRAIGAFRRVHDRALYHAAPLVIRQDMVGGRVGSALKRAYDRWLAAYWAAIRPLLR